MMLRHIFVSICLLFTDALVLSSTEESAVHYTREECNLPNDLIQEIQSHSAVVNQIIETATKGSFRTKTWRGLSSFVDKFGPRFSGTPELENAINYVLNNSIAFGLENVHGEPVKVPRWVRGEESATLLKPRKKNIALLGLGSSIGTPKEGITADAIVVNDFDELQRRAKEVPGKIVVYNQKFITYGKSVVYRSQGATKAAELGAVAALVRSVTPQSLYTPHTGMQEYGENVTKIPVACITVEDATLLERISNRGKTIRINLKMQAKNLPEVESRNIVAEIVGSEKPKSVVVISGHIDSWDVGQGAMDDGGGIFISWNALKLLNALKYRPRRTIRMIMWTAEEIGLVGAKHYVKTHKAEEGNLQFVMESDLGTFAPVGLKYSGNKKVGCIIAEVLRLLQPIGPMQLGSPNEGPDIELWTKAGVPGASLWTQDSQYFWYHHTHADTMLVEDSDVLDKNTAIFAAVSYVIANLSVDLPRQE